MARNFYRYFPSLCYRQIAAVRVARGCNKNFRDSRLNTAQKIFFAFHFWTVRGWTPMNFATSSVVNKSYFEALATVVSVPIKNQSFLIENIWPNQIGLIQFRRNYEIISNTTGQVVLGKCILPVGFFAVNFRVRDKFFYEEFRLGQVQWVSSSLSCSGRHQAHRRVAKERHQFHQAVDNRCWKVWEVSKTEEVLDGN